MCLVKAANRHKPYHFLTFLHLILPSDQKNKLNKNQGIIRPDVQEHRRSDWQLIHDTASALGHNTHFIEHITDFSSSILICPKGSVYAGRFHRYLLVKGTLKMQPCSGAKCQVTFSILSY